MALSITDLKKGTLFQLEGQPFRVVDYNQKVMGPWRLNCERSYQKFDRRQGTREEHLRVMNNWRMQMSLTRVCNICTTTDRFFSL